MNFQIAVEKGYSQIKKQHCAIAEWLCNLIKNST
jgi:hypothetical protein